MNDQVAEVKLHTDIVSIIGERIELKKAGRNYKASCPFHGEKTASFMVSPELQIFKCFGCSEAGDAFTFLEKFEGMEFPEALKYLADRAGIKLQRMVGGQTSEKEKIIEINTQALRFYNYLLLNHPVGKKALDYLVNERGLKKETIEVFQLGYSPEDLTIINKFLISKKKYTPIELEKSGIGIAKGVNIFDRFRGRVIFPLFDHRGNPIGFAGRILPWANQDMAKYINSPETPVYHKSSVLYGLNLTRSLIKKKKTAIIVEGELDAISSYQAGIKNVVAIKGSALTEDQVRLLSRFATKFILALDADLAGDAAARRGLTIAGNLGVEVKIAKLTSSKDPDEAARNDLVGYKKDLIASVGVWDYLIDSVFSRFDVSSGQGKSKISKELSPILAGIDDKIVQAHYANIVAGRLGVPQEAVDAEVKKVSTPAVISPVPITPETPVEHTKTRQEMLENRFLALAFNSDPKALLGSKDIIFSTLNLRLIKEYEDFAIKHKAFDISEFGQSLPAEVFEGFSKMVLSKDLEALENPDDIKKELDLVKKELKILNVKENLKKIAVEMRALELSGDKEKLLKVQEKFNKMAKSLSGYEESEASGIILSKEE
ncbi:MAG TPA: DNA primase [Patescibacteria group bacterium]|nr:DNA primase [Patescibacteria group bacterium]